MPPLGLQPMLARAVTYFHGAQRMGGQPGDAPIGGVPSLHNGKPCGAFGCIGHAELLPMRTFFGVDRSSSACEVDACIAECARFVERPASAKAP